MYAEHFGLNTPVFTDGISQDEHVFRGTRQQSLQTSLVIALTRSDSVALLLGESGTGKTTLAASTLRESATKLALGCLAYGPLTPHELLEQLLTEFGFTPYRNSRTERLAIWRQHLVEMSATGTRVCILVENADRLGTDVLAELESLTAADPRGGLGANIVLMARSQIETLDVAPELAPLRQRLRLIARLDPLDAGETEDYLRFRLEQAGGNWDEVAERQTAACLHRYSGGIIRVLDNLTETSLGLAAVRNAPQISADLVIEIAGDLQLTPIDEPVSDAADSAEDHGSDAHAQSAPDAVAIDDVTEPPEDHEDETDDATAQAGIVILVGDSREPEAPEAEALELEAREPEAPVPEARELEAREPEAPEPETPEPETRELEAREPAAREPDAPEPEAGAPADALHVPTDEPEIPVLEDIVELSATYSGTVATGSGSDSGWTASDTGPDDYLAAGEPGLAEEDREQIALLEAYTQTELRELDGLEELLAPPVPVESTSDPANNPADPVADDPVSGQQPDEEEEQSSAAQPSHWFA